MFFFFQAEDGIREAQESRGLGDVCRREVCVCMCVCVCVCTGSLHMVSAHFCVCVCVCCLLHISDAAGEEESVYRGSPCLIKKNNNTD